MPGLSLIRGRLTRVGGRWLAGLLLVGAAWPACPASVMKIEQLEGSGEVVNGASRDPLIAGLELQSGDEVSLAADSRASLALGRNGVLELGPGAALRVEQLPFASFADDLRTVLRLQRGYLRVIWKQRPWDLDWPLSVLLDAEQSTLGTGEYYFSHADDDLASARFRYCVAEGRIGLRWAVTDAASVLEPGACYRIEPPRLQASDPIDEARWTEMRRSRQMLAARAAEIEREIAPVAVTAAGLVRTDATAAEPAQPQVMAPLPPLAIPANPGAASASTDDPGLAPPATAWAIKFATYSDPAAARDLLGRVRKAGFKASLETVRLSKRDWYRVQITGIQTRNEAAQLLAALKAKGFAKAWIVTADQGLLTQRPASR